MTEEFTKIINLLSEFITEIEDPQRVEGGNRPSLHKAKEGISRETFAGGK
jgi:hypothetical protein